MCREQFNSVSNGYAGATLGHCLACRGTRCLSISSVIPTCCQANAGALSLPLSDGVGSAIGYR